MTNDAHCASWTPLRDAHFASRMGLRDDYAMARNYGSRMGRFSSPYPLAGSPADPQSLNHYTYARNDPVNSVDPSGMSLLCFWYGLFWVGGGDEPQFIPNTEHLRCLYIPDSGSFEPPLGSDEQSGGGGGGTPTFQVINPSGSGPNQTLINAQLKRLRDLLATDPDCLSFLGSKGNDPLKTLDSDINLGLVGHGEILENGNPYSNAAITGAGSLAPGFATLVNTAGAFFNAQTKDGRNLTLHGYAGGTPAAQLFTLLHEVGHQTEVLRPDAGRKKAQSLNDKDLDTKCRKTVKALGKS